jgi:hypothetical protein
MFSTHGKINLMGFAGDISRVYITTYDIKNILAHISYNNTTEAHSKVVVIKSVNCTTITLSTIIKIRCAGTAKSEKKSNHMV